MTATLGALLAGALVAVAGLAGEVRRLRLALRRERQQADWYAGLLARRNNEHAPGRHRA